MSDREAEAALRALADEMCVAVARVLIDPDIPPDVLVRIWTWVLDGLEDLGDGPPCRASVKSTGRRCERSSVDGGLCALHGASVWLDELD